METLVAHTQPASKATNLPVHLILLAHNIAGTVENHLRNLTTYLDSTGTNNYQITLIDTASTDRTLARAELIAREISRVNIVHSPSLNPHESLARLNLAPGSIILLTELKNELDLTLLNEGIKLAVQEPATVYAGMYPHEKQEVSSAKNMGSLLRIRRQETPSFLLLNTTNYRHILPVLEKRGHSENPLTQLYKTARQSKKIHLQHLPEERNEHPLAPATAALTIGTATLLMYLTLLNQISGGVA